MRDPADLLAEYLDHVQGRVRSGGGRAAVPADVTALGLAQPHECLALVVDALAEPVTPEHVRVVGDGLLEELLNESSDAVAEEVSAQLRQNKRFRQAFAFGDYTSVDPAVLGEWIDVLESLGTSKKAERRRLWSKKQD
jgi:hypothetical protein